MGYGFRGDVGAERDDESVPSDPTAEEGRPAEDDPGLPFLARMISSKGPASDLLAELVEFLHSTPEPDANLCLDLGCGDLESLVRESGVELWEQIESLARTDIRFRRALRSVWASESPEFDRREALLTELGEFRTVTVSFTMEPEDFTDDPVLSWRAVEIDGDVPAHRLAPTLRSIADWVERRPTDDRGVGGPRTADEGGRPQDPPAAAGRP